MRLATGPIRKALITRDKGCVCCGAPPLYCDAHHVQSWIDGGETKITNLALLCKRCHRDLHAGHWSIHITNGLVDVARPAWATPGPLPRDRYRPPTAIPHPTEPTPDSTTAGTATPDSTTPGTATAGGIARAWPRDTDPPWITPDDTARLNPWGDTPDHRPTPKSSRVSNLGTNATSTNATGAVDPWGDLAPESADDLNAADNDPKFNRHPADPCADSPQPHSTTTAA